MNYWTRGILFTLGFMIAFIEPAVDEPNTWFWLSVLVKVAGLGLAYFAGHYKLKDEE